MSDATLAPNAALTASELLALLDDPNCFEPAPEPIIYAPFTEGIWKGVWNWMTLTFAVSCATTGAALTAYTALIDAPAGNCAEIATRAFASDRDRLVCAQAIAATGDIGGMVEGLAVIRGWPADHPLHPEVRPLVADWSDRVFEAAEAHYQHRQELEAVRLLQHIPPISPRYGAAQTQLKAWRVAHYTREFNRYSQAQRALQNQQWAEATRQLWAMQGMEQVYGHSTLARTLERHIQAERQAQVILNEAIQRASSGQIEDVGRAIAIASTVNRNTYAWQTAQANLDRWSDALLNAGLDRWYAGELEAAIAIAQRVIPNPNRAQAAHDLILLSRSRQLALVSLRAPHLQSIGLPPAILGSRHIAPDSPFYPQAMSNAMTWQGKLQPVAVATIAKPPSTPSPSSPTLTAVNAVAIARSTRLAEAASAPSVPIPVNAAAIAPSTRSQALSPSPLHSEPTPPHLEHPAPKDPPAPIFDPAPFVTTEAPPESGTGQLSLPLQRAVRATGGRLTNLLAAESGLRTVRRGVLQIELDGPLPQFAPADPEMAGRFSTDPFITTETAD